jgi:hypothetical protein
MAMAAVSFPTISQEDAHRTLPKSVRRGEPAICDRISLYAGIALKQSEFTMSFVFGKRPWDPHQKKKNIETVPGPQALIRGEFRTLETPAKTMTKP